MAAREAVLEAVAARVPIVDGDDCVRVAVDGPDGAGKTLFADDLAATMRSAGRPVVRVSVDGFHHPRTTRYRRGRESPEGFWLDSYDYDRFRSEVLNNFGPNGSRRYRPAIHDVATDTSLAMAAQVAEPGTILVVDGIFLQRDELADAWDLVVFLDVPFAETARRMAARDGTDPDPNHPSTTPTSTPPPNCSGNYPNSP